MSGPKRQYRGDSAETRRLERRDRLIRAARRVFSERGYHNATVKSVCEEAGLTERYFYEAFQNQEGAFIAVHKDTSDHIIRLISEAADGIDGTPKEKVRAMLLAYFGDILRDPGSARLFAIESTYISPAANEVCAAWRNAYGAALAQTLKRKIAPGDAIVRNGVTRALLGIAVDWMEDGFSTPLEAVVDAAMGIAMLLQEK